MPPARRLHAEERKATIARAAGPLFARQGYEGTTIDDVATAVGVTKPIVYRHFDSKKDLYLALLRKHRDDLPRFAEGIEPPAAGAPPGVALRAILEVWLDYVRANIHAWWMLFRDAGGDEEIRAFRREVNLRAREVMAALITEWGGSDLPAEQVAPTAELLTSGLAGMALWWGEHPETPKEILVEVALRMTSPAFSRQP
jgi:AcrR family transcriptional regulator